MPGRKVVYMNNYKNISLLLLVLLTQSFSNSVYAESKPDIKLVLQITIDGLRADLLSRYQKNFAEGGFRYLLDEGVVYTDAHYQHANTETIVGHTTLATGAFPSTHGMVGNVWYDRKAGELSYNIEDPDSPLLPSRKNITSGEQLDPSQKISRTKGRSPDAILVATFSDGLAAYYGGRSKIFGVSGKDRSAVAMAGHVGKAFWYSTDTGDMVTSKYYYDDYPQWASDWNALRKAEKYAGTSWQLLNEKSTYLLAEQDDRAYETDLKGYGRVFPHPFGSIDDKLFLTRLLVSPVGDKLLLDFSKKLISSEQLGQDDIPDYFSISFSAVDVVNHFFGPSSLENEDTVLQLDRTLADLFKYIDKTVGLKHTLIVLSADHGMADMPEYMTEQGYKVGRIKQQTIIETANDVGKKQFGIDSIARYFFRPYMYLDEDKIAKAELSMAEVERAIAVALSDIEGIALAVPSSGFTSLQNGQAVEQIRRNYHPSRSGDIYVVQQPYWFMFESGPIAVMHGSPWRYDTHVPIIFAGAGIDSEVVHRLVHPVDVSPSIAAVLGMSPPAGSNGSVLVELFD
jgi:predicted AlkP superfamily pyrophosphatase or phosphodiesterase